MSIKVGDRVVCIEAHSSGKTTINGREYIVYGKITCVCGTVKLDVGFKLGANMTGTDCRRCGETMRGEIWWHDSSRFRKVEERTNYVKLEIEIEEPIYN